MRISQRVLSALGFALFMAAGETAGADNVTITREACCMWNVCNPIWGDGCFGDVCACSVTGSCCSAGRPCAGS